ncbi:MAG: helix-turn-helix domain-containing protein, partial [Planctomycetota bacterium]|nr:helix-turn-helix domain-containing protein [Planctomycetota bacterium]
MGGTNGTERDRFYTHRLITRARLALREKAVLWVLWDFENSRTGLAWPSADTISAMSGLSRREVFRAIKQLTTRGVLQLHARTPRMAQRAIDYERLERDCTPTGTPPKPAPSEVPTGHSEVPIGHSEVSGGHSEV